MKDLMSIFCFTAKIIRYRRDNPMVLIFTGTNFHAVLGNLYHEKSNK